MTQVPSNRRNPGYPGESETRTIPHRDPDTGRFVPDDAREQFDEIIQLHGRGMYSVPAADIDGSTGQNLGQSGTMEGDSLIDYQEHLDRTEFGVVLWQHQRLIVYIGSTQTADGTVFGSFELSLDPDRQVAGGYATFSDLADAETSGDYTIETVATNVDNGDDTPDVLGPEMAAVGFGPFSDGATGVGGAGTPGWFDWEGPIVHEPSVDDRDEIFVSGVLAHANVSDAALHADVRVYQLVGIVDTV